MSNNDSNIYKIYITFLWETLEKTDDFHHKQGNSHRTDFVLNANVHFQNNLQVKESSVKLLLFESMLKSLDLWVNNILHMPSETQINSLLTLWSQVLMGVINPVSVKYEKKAGRQTVREQLLLFHTVHIVWAYQAAPLLIVSILNVKQLITLNLMSHWWCQCEARYLFVQWPYFSIGKSGKLK